MRPLELGHELRDDLALAAHRPEAHDVRIVVTRAARRAKRDEAGDEQGAQEVANGEEAA